METNLNELNVYETNSPLDGALTMFRSGFKIFPVYGVINGVCQCPKGNNCPFTGKHPSVKDWQKFSFNSEENIHHHWLSNPSSNYGINPEGVVVLDIDERKGGYDSFNKHIRPLIAEHPTLTIQSGSGGNSFHLYFKSKNILKNDTGMFPGVDIKTLGGQVVGPGCNHKSGGTYKIIYSGSMNANEINMAELPPQIEQMLRLSQNDKTKNLKNIDIKANLLFQGDLPEGTRNTGIFTKGCQLRRMGLTIDEIRPRLQSLNMLSCKPPLEETEMENILSSIEQFPMREEQKRKVERNNDFQFVKAYDLLNEIDETQLYVVERLLLDNGTSLFVSKAKTGKTTLLRDLAVSVARGEKFLGYQTIQGPVLYLAMEEHKKFMKIELQKLGVNENDPIYIHAAPSPTNAVEKLRPLVEHYRPKLIIIDTLHKFTKFKNGNDYAEVNTALEPILTLARESDCHIAIAHHMGKSDDRSPEDLILGSTAIHGAFDTYIFITKNSQGDRVISTDQRHGENLASHFLKLDEINRKLSIVTKEEEVTSTIELEILKRLKISPKGVSVNELKSELGKRSENVLYVLNKLVAAEKVTCKGKGKKGDPKIYSIADIEFQSTEDTFGNNKDGSIPSFEDIGEEQHD